MAGRQARTHRHTHAYIHYLQCTSWWRWLELQVFRLQPTGCVGGFPLHPSSKPWLHWVISLLAFSGQWWVRWVQYNTDIFSVISLQKEMYNFYPHFLQFWTLHLNYWFSYHSNKEDCSFSSNRLFIFSSPLKKRIEMLGNSAWHILCSSDMPTTTKCVHLECRSVLVTVVTSCYWIQSDMRAKLTDATPGNFPNPVISFCVSPIRLTVN